MANLESTSWMNRCVPTAPVESDGAKSLSESPAHELTVLGASSWGESGCVNEAPTPPRAAFVLGALVRALIGDQVALAERAPGGDAQAAVGRGVGDRRDDAKRLVPAPRRPEGRRRLHNSCDEHRGERTQNEPMAKRRHSWLSIPPGDPISVRPTDA